MGVSCSSGEQEAGAAANEPIDSHSRMEEAPIKEMLLDIGTMDISDSDLDSDSFVEALQRHEGEGKNGAAAAEVPVFDARMLSGLREGMEPVAVRQLIDELFVKADQIIADLNMATASNDTITIAARAHELKGMAGNFGLVEISRLAERAEYAAKHQTIDGMSDVIANLEPANGRAKLAMDDWLAGK